jgi:hypothetical protein
MAITSTDVQQVILLLLATTLLLLAPICDAWTTGENKDYDGRNPLFGDLASSNDEECHDCLEDADSVPDALLIFTALVRWFAPTDF